ncbi:MULTISPECIES: YIP1 family protein [Kitasatospora]|uniref:YIP1 family protein n=1 Tax=Kitasatospora cathayae TaxID=3004092 RepID=A0ABY7Q710_9ACTN|nr:YIP1 family protein [Kitasatospora sp. HUAS 3-15]WBP87954.1 YIP1 family protein [Kitasatospora sp. HUAS 3-15]
MVGNRYDSGQGADRPHGGWPAPPPPQAGAPGGYGRTDGPEYFTAAHPTAAAGPGGYGGSAGHGGSGGPAGPRGSAEGPGGTVGAGYDPYAADRPGNTRAFPLGDPYEQQPYGQDHGHYGRPPAQGHYEDGGYGQQPPYGGQDQQPPPPYGQDNVTVYRAGGQSAPHVSGPRPQWRELFVGIFRSPTETFDRTRDHQVWLPALTVSLLYGVLAVLGIGLTHDDIVDSTFSVALTGLCAAAVCFTVVGAVFGAVTYALARQLGGAGPWKSTIGLAALIGWLTDAPRLLIDLVLPSGSAVVQAVGWATWMLCAYLLTGMVRRVHDLPWGKAAAAAAVQLVALLVLIKLPTLG